MIEHAQQRDFAVEVASAVAAVLTAATRLPATAPVEPRIPNGPSDGPWKDRFASDRILGGGERVLADDLVDIWRILARRVLASTAEARSRT